MSSRHTVAKLLLACVCGAQLACGAASAPHPKSAHEVSVATLYPLALGAAWSYDVDSGDGQPVLATAHVVSVRDGAVEVASGQALLHYVIVPEGIARAGQTGHLLKTPLTSGASWPSAPDTVARVEAVHQRVAIPAGTFEECVVVKEENANTGQHVTTTYCPGVGPARVVSEMEVRGHALRVTATLRGYALPEPG
jgi:hypothetical protein